MARSGNHLTEAQILQAVVDLSDLTDVQQAHLKGCPACLAKKDRLDHMLSQVGNMARASAPAVVSRPVFTDRPTAILPRSLFNFRPFIRIALPVVFVLVIVATVLVLKPAPVTHMASEEAPMIDPEQLLSDIDSLIENPLPQGFQPLLSFAGIDSEEDFMEFIVPVPEDDPLSNKTGEKGESIC